MGSFLGRTPISWVKILGFYAVYYTALYFLASTGIKYYQTKNTLPPGEGASPTIKTRLDMPGASSYLHQKSDLDGSENMFNMNVKNADGEFEYDSVMNQGINFFKNNTEAPWVQSKVIAASRTEMKPIVFISMNKVFDWNAINNKQKLTDYSASFYSKMDDNVFKVNSIYFDCYEYIIGDGSRVIDSRFEFTGNQNVGIAAADIYYKGEENFQKSYLPIQITAKDNESWSNFEPKQHGVAFRCDVLADNIDVPLVGPAFDNAGKQAKGASEDLTKLGIGFVQFGFNFEKTA